MKRNSMTRSRTGMAAIAFAAGLALAGCSSASPDTTGAQDGAAGRAPQGTAATPANGGSDAQPGSGSCSDPNPDPASLTFAAIICVTSQSKAEQADGSHELKVKMNVTSKDSNAFTFSLEDLRLLDAAGNPIKVDYDSPNKTGTSDCVLQKDSAFAGWPMAADSPAFTPPGPICFNVPAGSQPTQLVWQDDVVVPLG